MRKQKDDPEVVAWTIAAALTLAFVVAAFWLMLATGFVPPCHETYTKAGLGKCPPLRVSPPR